MTYVKALSGCSLHIAEVAIGSRSAIVVLMSAVYFTLVAIILYFAADWILERVEIAAGTRLEHRSLIFFVILMTLALTSFALIQNFTGGV